MKEKASRDFCRGQTFLLTANKKVLVELSWVPSLRRQQNNFPFVWRSGTQSFLKVSSSEEDKKRSDAFEEINLAWRKLRYRHEVWSVRVCVCVFVQLKNAISYAHHVSNFFSFFLHTTRASEVARKMYSRSSTFVEITFRSPFSSFIMNTNTAHRKSSYVCGISSMVRATLSVMTILTGTYVVKHFGQKAVDPFEFERKFA